MRIHLTTYDKKAWFIFIFAVLPATLLKLSFQRVPSLLSTVVEVYTEASPPCQALLLLHLG